MAVPPQRDRLNVRLIEFFIGVLRRRFSCSKAVVLGRDRLSPPQTVPRPVQEMKFLHRAFFMRLTREKSMAKKQSNELSCELNSQINGRKERRKRLARQIGQLLARIWLQRRRENHLRSDISESAARATQRTR